MVSASDLVGTSGGKDALNAGLTSLGYLSSAWCVQNTLYIVCPDFLVSLNKKIGRNNLDYQDLK